MTDVRICVRWSPAEDAALRRLRDIEHLDWLAIAAALPGRSAGACEQRYYGKLKGASGRARRPSRPKLGKPVSWRKRGAAVAGVVAAPAPREVAAAPAPAPVVITPRIRMPSLDGLRERAELHLRIAERGLTGGVFGDPAPGRSALDERTRAAAEALVRRFDAEASDG